MNRLAKPCWLVGLAFAAAANGQQVADPDFAPPIEKPGYEIGRGPRVVIDAARLNFHTADGRYAPFAELLRRDGYRWRRAPSPMGAAAASAWNS